VSIFCVVVAARALAEKSDVAEGEAARVVPDAGAAGFAAGAAAGAGAGAGAGRAFGGLLPTSIVRETTTAGAPCTGGFCAGPVLGDDVWGSGFCAPGGFAPPEPSGRFVNTLIEASFYDTTLQPDSA
jgi:hypothetical protein